MTKPNIPPPRPGKKTVFDTRLMKTLNANITKLAIRLEQTHLTEFVEMNRKPGKLMWTNFLAGMARGVGLFVGGGLMGAIVLALMTWSIYHLLKVFDMIPVLNQLSKLLGKQVTDFLVQHHITR